MAANASEDAIRHAPAPTYSSISMAFNDAMIPRNPVIRDPKSDARRAIGSSIKS